MAERTLTIQLQSDWQSALRSAAHEAAYATGYLGEQLNFESLETFFGYLTVRRWGILETLMRAGELPLPELARQVGCDLDLADEDVRVLTELGLVERTATGGVVCPFADIRIDVRLHQAARAA
jgi:predicted transcriptional regulator